MGASSQCPPPLLSRHGTRRRLLAALSLAVQTPICRYKSLSETAVIHIRDQELPVTNIIAEQPMGIKHLIRHMGECQPCVFSHKTKWGLKSHIIASHVVKLPEKD